MSQGASGGPLRRSSILESFLDCLLFYSCIVLISSLRIAETCSAFDGSPLGAHQMISGVADGRGVSGDVPIDSAHYSAISSANRALGLSTHSDTNPIGIGSTSGGSNFIEDSNELFCYDFDAECRWRNMEGLFVDELDWYQGSGLLDQGRLQVATGTHISPEGMYAIVATDKMQLATSKAILISDTVACQIGPGEIRFLYWTSPQVQLKVCVKRVTRLFPDYDYCTPPVEGPDPGPAHLSLPDQGREPFQIYIIAESFIFQAANLQGGFAIVDNLEYYADMCPPITMNHSPTPPTPLFQGLLPVSTTPLPQLIQLPENYPQDSNGRMVMHSTLTRRGPLPGDAQDRAIALSKKAKQFPKAHHQISRRVSPEGREEINGSDNGEDEDDESTEKEDSAAEVLDGESEENTKESQSPSKGAALERSLGDTVSNSLGQEEKVDSREDVCEVVNCRFEQGNCARLVQGTDFHISTRPVGNPLTGIRGDASFLPYNKDGSFVYIRGPRAYSRLSTPSFNLSEDAYFIFAYHKVDHKSIFRVFALPKGEANEFILFEAPSMSRNTSRRWFREGRLLPHGDYEYVRILY